MNFDINKVMSGLEDIRCREREELRKLLEQPELFDVAQKLMDALLRNLNYLCNFDHLVNGNGGRTEITEVITKLEGFVKDTFRELTGKEYQLTVCRSFDYSKKKRFLKQVMRQDPQSERID